MSKNISHLSGRKGLENNLFDKLGNLSLKNDGTPSPEDLETLAKEFLVGNANTYGSATFYDFMKPENKGKKAYVCNGSACLCAGKQEDVKANLSGVFKPDEIGHMTCLGRCHENAAFHINGKNYSGQDYQNLKEITEGAAKKDKYHISGNKEVLTRPYTNLQTHYQPFLEGLNKSPENLLEEIKTSNIRGRGGAGFPMWIKLDTCKKEESDQKFIICNADEGDPGAYSDRYLLEERPHSVLFGMMMAGRITGASWGVLYIRAEYPESVEIIEKAIQALREQNWLGKDILGSGFDFDFKVIKAQGAYICGEETALINSIEGQRPEVRTRPPFPAQKGLFQKPTIVNNVETLAALHFIFTEGGAAYAGLGTEKSTGTKLVCLDSFFHKPGIVEVEMGTPLSEVFETFGGGLKSPVKAFHIGGPLGGIVPLEKVGTLKVDFESFANEGFLLGHASVVSIPESFPMVEYLKHLFDFAAYESCGKCFPCRLGTTRAFELFEKTTTSDYKISRKLFDDLMDTLQQGSLCAHGGGIPLPAKNALSYFGKELEDHFTL